LGLMTPRWKDRVLERKPADYMVPRDLAES
jgi:hypothetical protein